ncbi:hypothetical protein HYC85_026891 [Camellia sinensis]|uniref:Uncharacterized protein n=1 Tax=Camellia sinensis TaxID=4442 RepID=A0A7J7G4U2_CAMSI|nr:hypothetical protein HYC85_026891 [Camellia sinensis]
MSQIISQKICRRTPARIHYWNCVVNKTESICWDESSHMVLLRKLEAALKDHQVDEAWETHNDFRNLYGFLKPVSHDCPTHLIPTGFKRHAIVFLIQKEKSDLVRSNFLIKLSLSLARAQMPVSASMISRLLLEKESLPPANIFGQVFMHMVKTEVGTYLASNILIELCDQFQHSSANRSKLIKPDTMIFNLVLDACVRFGSSFKGQQIIELMAQAGVIADAHAIDIISLIFQMNDRIDQVSVPLLHHYGQFYDSLLGLHFKFNDVDVASGLILDIYVGHDALNCSAIIPFDNNCLTEQGGGSQKLDVQCDESRHSKKYRKDPQKPCLVPIGSHNLRAGLKI